MKRFILFMSILALCLTPIFAQDNELTIAEWIATNPEFSSLSEAIEAADPFILEALSEPDANLTFFAPTNEAFDSLRELLSQAESFERIILEADSYEEFLSNTDDLSELILFHAFSPAITWEEVLAGLENVGEIPHVALNGSPAFIRATLWNSGDIVMEQGIQASYDANIDMQIEDIELSNGVIYVIDAVLLPELRTIAEMISEDASYEDYPEFTILMEILEEADPAILDLLNEPQANISFFAPYDSAFESLDAETLEALRTDSEQATAFLYSMIFPQIIYSFQIPELLDENGLFEIEMADSSEGEISLPEDSYYGEFYLNDAYISFPDRMARNGVIHDLDSFDGAGE